MVKTVNAPRPPLDEIAAGLPRGISVHEAFVELMGEAVRHPELVSTRSQPDQGALDLLRDFTDKAGTRSRTELFSDIARSCLEFVTGALERRTLHWHTLESDASIAASQAANLERMSNEITEIGADARQAAFELRRHLSCFAAKANDTLAGMTLPHPQRRLDTDEFAPFAPYLQAAESELRVVLGIPKAQPAAGSKNKFHAA